MKSAILKCLKTVDLEAFTPEEVHLLMTFRFYRGCYFIL